MGSIIRPIKKAAKQLTKGVGTVVEKAIEDPVKKIGKESFDIIAGTTDEERRLMLGEMPDMTPEITPEVTPEVVPDDDTLMGRGTRRTRAAKRSGGAGTLMEGYGVAFAKPSPKAPTGSG
tara:strand:- start:122 stop:481 length:360 start_codon:yes stop_codon:yes gene_type:complete